MRMHVPHVPQHATPNDMKGERKGEREGRWKEREREVEREGEREREVVERVAHVPQHATPNVMNIVPAGSPFGKASVAFPTLSQPAIWTNMMFDSSLKKGSAIRKPVIVPFKTCLPASDLMEAKAIVIVPVTQKMVPSMTPKPLAGVMVSIMSISSEYPEASAACTTVVSFSVAAPKKRLANPRIMKTRHCTMEMTTSAQPPNAFSGVPAGQGIAQECLYSQGTLVYSKGTLM